MPQTRSAKRCRDKRSLARIAKAAKTFDFDPSKPILSETMGWEVIKRRVLPAVNDDAYGCWELLELARSYFRSWRFAAVSFQQRRMYNCFFVATLCLASTAKREQGDIKSAERLLRRACRESGNCPECLAEIERRLGLLYFSKGDAARANAKIQSAAEIYHELGHDGHNLSENGPASCLFAASAISWMTGEIDDALEQIFQVISLLDPDRSPELFHRSQLNLARFLFDAGEESRFPEALLWLDRAAPYFYRIKEPTATQARLEWNRGMIRGRLGDARAESHLERSRSQFIATRHHQDAVTVTSDLTHFHLIRHRPPRLIEPVVAEAEVLKARVPWRKWVPEPTRPPFKRLLRCLRSGKPPAIWDACVSLRELSSAGGAMPSLLPSMRFIG